MDARALLLNSFDVVIRRAHPAFCIQPFIPDPPKGRLIVVGAGKASAAMAAAFEVHYKGAIEGLVITRYGHCQPTEHIHVVEAAHPVPDEAGQQAVSEIFDLLGTAGADDLIVCLISGGGSSLLSQPVEGITFADLQNLQRALLGSGASIQDMNIVRKHINSALGGGLAKAAPQTCMVTLAISDVVGDDPSVIASGASVADPSTLAEARNILERYGLDIPPVLYDQANETPKLDDPVFNGHEYHLIATPAQSLEAAKLYWESNGFDTHIWDIEVEGDSTAAAACHVQYVISLADSVTQPCAIISGGETTMTLNANSGKGGPNSHFMLEAAKLLDGHPRIYAMACDTDGIDGYGDHAGALITPKTLDQALAQGFKPDSFLAQQNSYAFFDGINGLVKTGATYTNVNDYRIFLLLP